MNAHPAAAPVLRALIAVGLVASGPAQADDAVRFQDPLATPAKGIQGEARSDRQPLMAVARAGRRVVAVGLRGLILVSDDDGGTWRQASVPVQSDLVAVTFATPRKGWAAGHEGVILATDDGGETWRKQLDGQAGAAALVGYYQRRVDAGDVSVARALQQVKLNTQNGPSLPYLDIVFEDERVGYAVGPFATIVRTDDGGATWIPWLEHVENDDYLNLNAIACIGGYVFIAGEGGRVYVLDRKAARFSARPTGYRGSFFGIVGEGDVLIAFGLRGSVYRSEDAGKTWGRVETGVAGNLTGGTVARDRKTVALVSDGGIALRSGDAGRSFRPLQPDRPMLFTGAVEAEGGRLVLVGFQGTCSTAAAVAGAGPEGR
jgi:photosystem II stability/assembly factor-like uncharacterized protein